jgi:DNA replication protein DnaC
MDDLALLKPKLIRLKLSGMLDTLDERLSQAVREKWSHTRFISQLFADEVERRDGKNLARRVTKSGLDPARTLEVFDFPFNPKISETAIRELATCSFIGRKENIFLLGPSGVGKSHIAQALGNAACRRGHDVIFERTDSLMKHIQAGIGDGTRERRLYNIARIPLLILDDFGLLPLDPGCQTALYELICERYEKSSTIITSNRDFQEWMSIFANPLVASAAMDRLVHRACKIVIEGKSYRIDAFGRRNRKSTKEA